MPLAFVGTDVVPMDRERVLKGRVVIVRDGRIDAIGPTEEVAIPEDARVIPAAGKYLIPGLADMHVHLRGAPSVVEQVLTLYLVNGVTTVLNLDGGPMHLRLRAAIEREEMLAPRLFTSGPTLRGNPPATYEQGRDVARRVVREGYDYVKVYSFLPEAAYRGAIAEAIRLGIPVVGHAVRPAGGIAAALENGQHIVHMEEFIYGHFRPDEAGSSSRPTDPEEVRRRVAGYLDESRIDELARETAASGIHVTPNLVAYHFILLQVRDLEAVLARPEVRYLPASILDGWGPANNGYTTRPNLPLFEATLGTSFPFLQKLTGAFQRAGVPLLMGTDAAIPVMVPGFSAHDDLGELVDAGLTPYEALLAATRTPAEFLRRIDDSGTVQVGKAADLVLLEGNPLVDIGQTRRIAGVMRRGHWLSREELDRLLDELEH